MKGSQPAGSWSDAAVPKSCQNRSKTPGHRQRVGVLDEEKTKQSSAILDGAIQTQTSTSRLRTPRLTILVKRSQHSGSLDCGVSRVFCVNGQEAIEKVVQEIDSIGPSVFGTLISSPWFWAH